MPARKRTSTMTKSHKDALATGRLEARTVRVYLEALEADRPRRGRKRTPESTVRRPEAIEEALGSASPVSRLHLLQERLDLTRELAALDGGVTPADLEDGFVAALAGYSERKAISYAAWREIGVSAALLKRAGITRTG